VKNLPFHQNSFATFDNAHIPARMEKRKTFKFPILLLSTDKGEPMPYSMKRSQTLAMLMTMLSLLGLYHLCILLGLLPSEYVWLGRIQTHDELLKYEAVSLAIIVTAVATLVLESLRRWNSVTRVLLYLFTALFAANTVANLFAPTWTERIAFTVVALVLTLLTYRLIHLNKEMK
jgi:hypothetical protein